MSVQAHRLPRAVLAHACRLLEPSSVLCFLAQHAAELSSEAREQLLSISHSARKDGEPSAAEPSAAAVAHSPRRTCS